MSLWKDELRVKESLFNSILGGGVSGFLAGLIGTGGALWGAFLTAILVVGIKFVLQFN